MRKLQPFFFNSENTLQSSRTYSRSQCMIFSIHDFASRIVFPLGDTGIEATLNLGEMRSPFLMSIPKKQRVIY